jgi:hypothetical protein
MLAPQQQHMWQPCLAVAWAMDSQFTRMSAVQLQGVDVGPRPPIKNKRGPSARL